MVVKEDRSVYLENLENDPVGSQSEVVIALGIKSVAGTPLRYEGRVVGALTVGKTYASKIAAEDITLIGYMANQITTAIVKAQLYKKEQEARVRLGALENIAKTGLKIVSIDDLIDQIKERIIESTGMSWGAIILLNSRSGYPAVEYASSGCNMLKGRNIIEDFGLINEILAAGETRIVKKSEFSGKEYGFIDKKIKSIAMIPIALMQNRVCIIALGKNDDIAFEPHDIVFIEALAHRAMLAIENSLLFCKLERSYLETIESLVKAVEAKDQYTCGHSEEVAAISKGIALAMGIDEARAEQVHAAGLLHDVGKIGISSKILYKAACLNCEEYAEIKLHSLKGYQILKPLAAFEDLADIVLQHHERYDGSGYPYGISGEGILIQARILAVADAYQAMISERPYREPLPCEQAIVEIRKGSGSQFDPRVADVFIALFESGELPQAPQRRDTCSVEMCKKASDEGRDCVRNGCTGFEVA